MSERTRLVLVMVAKPARGKTYTAKKLARYLNWRGVTTRVFNVGDYRRRHLGTGHTASFFDPANTEGMEARESVARLAVDDLLEWVATEGEVGILDATNSTRARREWIVRTCEEAETRAVFIELQCEIPEVIAANVKQTKLDGPDYLGMDPETAVSDFLARIDHYERSYQPVEDETLNFIRIVDMGRKVVVNRVQGWVEGRVVQFLMNLRVVPRTVWFTRHGESEFNVLHRLGGDAPLAPRGRVYAGQLANYFRAELGDTPYKVWTSTLQRTIQTAAPLEKTTRQIKALDEIDAGLYDGMTYDEIALNHPDEFAARKADKLRYRYPRGESYKDVIRRLDKVILDLERVEGPVLIVAHQAILRALYAYFTDVPLEDCPHLPIPLHTVIELQSGAYAFRERRTELPPGP